MPLHLIKLCVGCDSIRELEGWVAEAHATARKKGLPLHHIHVTRMTPKRGDEIARRRLALLGDQGRDRRARENHRHRAVPRQGRHRTLPARDAAQGDRRLAAADAGVPGLALSHAGFAPPDLGKSAAGVAAMPEPMRRELRELGLL